MKRTTRRKQQRCVHRERLKRVGISNEMKRKSELDVYIKVERMDRRVCPAVIYYGHKSNRIRTLQNQDPVSGRIKTEGDYLERLKMAA